MALEIVIIHFLAGAALGLRFKVMILVPALTLTMLFAAMVGVTRGDKFWFIAVAMILLGTAIQCWNPYSSQNRIGSSAANGGHNVEVVAVSGAPAPMRLSQSKSVTVTTASYSAVFHCRLSSPLPLQIRLL